jgi:eukaryotic-like serine/threonine-protein kinase
VFGVAWSPDGKYIASGGRDTTVQVWSASTGVPLFIYRDHADNVDTVAWSPNGKRIASAGGHDDRSRSSRNDHTVQVWNPLNGDNVLIYDKHSNRVHSVAWSPDRTLIVSGGYDRTAQVWKAD